MALDVTQVRESAIHVARHPQTRKVAIWIAAIFAAIGVLLGLIAPPLLRGKIASTLSNKFHRQVSIEQIRKMTVQLYVDPASGVRMLKAEGKTSQGFIYSANLSRVIR